MTGRELLAGVGVVDPVELSRRVFEASFVLASHGLEGDPVLSYGNRAALELWGMSWEEFVVTPSRYTAEVPEREERSRFLAAVSNQGFIDDYSGVRIAKSGRRFRIGSATVWNLVGDDGGRYGQAATFERWEYL
ncbi:MAG: hypothetical protein RI897_1468 [Verrucomicrobiota bacterium]